MVIKLNGKDVNLDKELSIQELLALQHIVMPDYVTVQVNGEFVEHEQYSDFKVKDQDAVEFIFYMSGGGF